jgi:choline dehydrogenase-like flavoprotein
MTFVGESLPETENRLVLSDRKDRFGLPLARVRHRFGPDSVQCWQAGIGQGKEIFKAAGAYDVWTSRRAQMHTMGGAIMGRSAQGSVTDSYGKTHDLANLFIAGSSLFPTTGGVNPTFTINALALRSARHILDHWSSFH